MSDELVMSTATPPSEYIVQFMSTSHSAWILTAGPCMAFLFMSRYRQHLLVL